MKLSFIAIILSMAFFTACQFENKPVVDLATLQKKIDADAGVQAYRAAFLEYSRLLIDIGPEALSEIHATIKTSGIRPFDCNLDELGNAIRSCPKSNEYVLCQRQFRTFQALKIKIEQTYPELSQIDPADVDKLLSNFGENALFEIIQNRLSAN